ncbi:MAG: glycoside hydrolase family 57 protein [Candidatus Aenigmatarchaeota archaeon]
MPGVCFYFQVHQPMRLRKFTAFDIGNSDSYFDDERNKFYLERVSRKCYLPANKKMLDLIESTGGRFRISYSLSGIVIEQLEKFFPEVMDSFRKLVDTGCVDILNETYYHSLAFLISKKEFSEQVKMHREKIKSAFGVKGTVFRNTEAMYSNDVARAVEELGYKAIVAEGLDHVLQWRSPNYLYKAKDSGMKVFLRNYKLSDDIAFRFSTKDWAEWPLKADKFASWLAASEGQMVNLFMDYETFGEHQWHETGIFDFLQHLPKEVLKHDNMKFMTLSEALKSFQPVGDFDVPHLSSWADVHRDASAWLENSMQRHAFDQVKELHDTVRNLGDPELLDKWRKLQTSDHFYYMCTKWFADGDVHKYFNHYDTPYDAFLNFMNVLTDLKQRVEKS